jgi:hypothetical protein
MRAACAISIGVLATGVAAQIGSSVFEPQNFNISAALKTFGVDVSTLPEPADTLHSRSSDAQCSHAVSLTVAQRSCNMARANIGFSVPP